MCSEINNLTGFSVGIIPFTPNSYQLISRLDPDTGQSKDDMIPLLRQRSSINELNSYLRSAKNTIIFRNGVLDEMSNRI